MNPPVQRRLAAILAADVLGFSRMMGADEEGTIARLRDVRAVTIDPAIERHGGRIFKTTGDGVLAEFPSVVAAVRCGVEIQVALRTQQERSDSTRIVLRIGINLGDIMVDGDDIFGDGVNIAARIEGVCEPGGVALAASAHEQVRDKFELDFVDCGERELKNIARRVRIYAVDLSKQGISARAAVQPRARWISRLRYAVAAFLCLTAVGWLALDGSVDRVRRGLERLRGTSPASAPAPAARASIAVLPLVNLSGDAERDYYSDGITQDVIGALGRFSGLMVISYSGVQAYRAGTVPPAQASRELGVRYLVQGNVRQAQNRLRVSVELSDTERGQQLWSEHFEGEGKDVFTIQDQIVRRVVGALAVKISRLESQRASAKPPDSLEAYDMVLRARDLIRRSDRAANRQARGLAAQAIALAPGYADAYVTLSAAEWQRAELGWIENAEEGVRRSEELARKAAALDDPGAQSRAFGRLGIIASYRGQFEEAIAQVERAMELNPNDSDAQELRASVLLWQGKIGESIAAYAAVRQFDPRMSSNGGISLALAYLIADQPQSALAVTADSIARYPKITFLHALRATAFEQLGRHDEARQEAALVRALNPLFEVDQFGTRFRDPVHREKIQRALRKAGL